MPLASRVPLAALIAALALAGCGGSQDPARHAAPSATPSASPSATATDAPAASPRTTGDWNRFGYDAARTSRAPRGIAPERVAGLRERRIALPGTVDASPIYLAGVRVAGH